MRSRTLPLLQFLAPSIPRNRIRCHLGKVHSSSHPSLSILQTLCFTSSARCSAQAATATIEPDEDVPINAEQDKSRRETSTHLSSLTSRGSARQGKEGSGSYGEQLTNQFETLMSPLNDPRKVMRDEHERFTKYKRGDLQKLMKLPQKGNQNDSLEKQERYNKLGSYLSRDRRVITEPQKRTIRSSPMVGTTIEMNPDKRVDFARGLTKLNQECRLNDIRNQALSQKYRERAGQMRKRLRRERWRRYFAHGFKAAVNRVHTMKAQGW